MTALLINSQESFQRAMGVLREEFGRHHYLKINLKIIEFENHLLSDLNKYMFYRHSNLLIFSFSTKT